MVQDIDVDSNTPLKKPYVFQEFPKILYWQDGTHQKVHSHAEEKSLVKDGWANKPFPKAEEPDPALEASIEIAALTSRVANLERLVDQLVPIVDQLHKRK